jgi:starvation-inducible DNA-binding protein
MPFLTTPDPQEDAAKQVIIDALLPCLADLLDLAGNAKLAHWNVRGQGFKPIHEALDDVMSAARDGADTIAERVTLELGGLAIGTARQVAEGSRLDDYPEDERDPEAICGIINDMAREACAGLKAARAACREQDDDVTENMLQDVDKKIQHAAGILVAHLPK